MLKAAVVTLEDWRGQSIRVQAVRKARFLSPIQPEQSLMIKCVKHQESGDECTAHLTLRGTANRKTSECIIQYRPI
jgi:3-hydroxymyristoyl/3-hydroxydecanoyl-(acyl carrier protein) dehydratase